MYKISIHSSDFGFLVCKGYFTLVRTSCEYSQKKS